MKDRIKKSLKSFVINSIEVEPKKKFPYFLRFMVALVLSFVLTVGLGALIWFLQLRLIVQDDYLIYIFKYPYLAIIFLFEIQFIIIFFGFILKEQYNIFHLFKKHYIKVVLANWVAFYLCITGISVITDNGIKDYSFYNVNGTQYSFDDVKYIDTGFQGERAFLTRKGDFYYVLALENGMKINLDECSAESNDTYSEIEKIDKKLMDMGIQKFSSDKYIEKCDLDKDIVDQFKRIIENKSINK